MARVYLLYLGQIRNPKNVLKQIGLTWTNLQKSFLPELRSVEPIVRSIEPGQKAQSLLALTRFQLYIDTQL